MTDASTLRRTPLHSFHQQFNAHLVDFAGWEMPLHYGSILEEHKLVRSSAGLFDVSHMGRVIFTGSGARRFLERVLTRRISNMEPGQCRYALVCNEAGGALDDVIVYRFDDYWMLVVNAANREKLLAHFDQVKAAENFEVKIDDITAKTAMLACQGPEVMQIIGHFTSEVPALKNYHFCQKNLMVVKFTISRTGYTGEDGVEVIMGSMTAPMAIRLLMNEGGSQAAKIKPAGLGARDTLRLEAGMPLYGHELGEQTNPLEAGLNFAVNLDKGAEPAGGPQIPRFIGQDALEQVATNGVSKKLIGLQLDGKRTPRQGAAVSRDGKPLGTVTSGCLSPTLGYPIAMAYVQPDAANVGDTVQVVVGNSVQEARIVKLPFYKRAK